MTPPFKRTITITCFNCGRPIVRLVGVVAATERLGRLPWCRDCWPARKRELDRNYRARRRHR